MPSTQIMKLETIITNFLSAKDETSIEQSSKDLKEYFNTANPSEQEVIKGVIKAKAKMMSMEANELIEQSKNYISTPEFVIDLNEWITIKEYAKRFEVASTNVVSNWIKRGIIPSENVRTLPMLNGIKVIKAVKYL